MWGRDLGCLYKRYVVVVCVCVQPGVCVCVRDVNRYVCDVVCVYVCMCGAQILVFPFAAFVIQGAS